LPLPFISDLYGRSFEHFIGMELRAYTSYARTRDPIQFWRSTHGYEVDYLVGGRVAIEVKASRRASLRDARGLVALKEEGTARRFILVSENPTAARSEGIELLPWTTFLRNLWDGRIV